VTIDQGRDIPCTLDRQGDRETYVKKIVEGEERMMEDERANYSYKSPFSAHHAPPDMLCPI
jgi:hypothetical protein